MVVDSSTFTLLQILINIHIFLGKQSCLILVNVEGLSTGGRCVCVHGGIFFLVENTNPREFAKVDQAWCYSQK